MRRWASNLASSDLVRNAVMLSGAQIGRKLLPLVTLPYLARTLGPDGWGLVAFTQSLAELVVLTIEFGFSLSATRAIARNRESKAACGSIAMGVLGAQALLASAGVLAALLVIRWIPSLAAHPDLVAAGLFYAVAQGLTPLWLLQGLEQMRLAVLLETGGRAVALLALFAWVHAPGDEWKALAVQGIGPAIATVGGLAIAYRQLRWPAPRWADIREVVADGWKMFVFKSGESLYGVGNAFILGLFASHAEVGYFVSAEKISKAAFGLLNPVRETLYPRLSHLAQRSEAAAAGLARKGAVVMISGGFLIGIVVFAGAPLGIRLLMGKAFEPAVIVLRILAVLPPVLAVTYSIGLQWLLPLGRDSEVNRAVVGAGLLNLVLAWLLAPAYAHVGMAVAIVCAELSVCLALVRVALRSTSLFRAEIFSPALELK